MWLRGILLVSCALLLLITNYNVAMAQDDTEIKTTPKSKYLSADDVPACTEKKPDSLKKCLIHSFTILVPRYKNGDPDLNIPKLEPFTLNRTVFHYKWGPVSGKFILQEAVISGLTNMEFHDASFEMKGEKNTIFYMKSFAPHVTISGKYKANFSINQAHLNPKGDFVIDMKGISMDQNSTGTLYDKDNHKFVHINTFDVEPDIKNMKIKFNGIFEDPELNQVLEDVLNQNWRDIMRIMLPQTRSYWTTLLLQVANSAMASIPFDNFIKI